MIRYGMPTLIEFDTVEENAALAGALGIRQAPTLVAGTDAAPTRIVGLGAVRKFIAERAG